MFRPIYEPRTRAKEYSNLAINIYEGCNHSCVYCYARKNFNRWNPGKDFTNIKPREDIVKATERQLMNTIHRDMTIMLCFTCDPYPAIVDTVVTREIIKAIKDSGNHVSILTKGGKRAERDFDLLDENDSFGVTISCSEPMRKTIEPGASEIAERIESLMEANRLGIKTWVSCEPIYEESAIFYAIKECSFIDLFKIGKLNYYPSKINWAEFGRECERLCIKNNRNYYIKEDLRVEMNLSAGSRSEIVKRGGSIDDKRN